MDTPSVGKSSESQSLNNLSAQLCNTNDHLSKVAGNIQEFTLFCTSTQAKCWGNLCRELQILNTQLAVQSNELKGINSFIRSWVLKEPGRKGRQITMFYPTAKCCKSPKVNLLNQQESLMPTFLPQHSGAQHHRQWILTNLRTSLRKTGTESNNSKRATAGVKMGINTVLMWTIDGSPHGKVRPIQTANHTTPVIGMKVTIEDCIGTEDR